ncbi:hypothetical protein GP486_005591 [Trichoglossum hirsutum]|uniref:C2H2-type domain-containing protein n=1 Tax=Trichoglossum hirsutum TaxID=265104 RepID=A0A9P8L8Z4_9PEZI|nr:hypothetical protein GP486_005591 [Trichoglossum hirsutum]
MPNHQLDRSEVLREFYRIALDRDINPAGGNTNPWRRNPVDPVAGICDGLAEDLATTATIAQDRDAKQISQLSRPSSSTRLESQQPTKSDDSQQDLASSASSRTQSFSPVALGYDEIAPIESSHTSIGSDRDVQLEDPSSPGDLIDRDLHEIALDTIVATPEERPHDGAPVQPVLVESHPSDQPPRHLSEDEPTPERALGRTEFRASQLREKIKDELSALRNLNIALQAKSTDASMQGEYQQISYAPADSVEEPISWLDTMRHNVYYNLEGEGKQSHIDMWHLKSRHGRPSSTTSRRKRRRANVQDATEEDREALLGRCSPALSENEASTPVIDTLAQTSMPLILPPRRPASSSTLIRPSGSSVFTLALVFGEGTGSSLSTRPPPSSAGTALSWLGSPSHPRLNEGETGRLKSSSSSIEKFKAVAAPDDIPGPVQCTFCLKRFTSQRAWDQHEQSQHLPQQEWVCMPWGPVEEIDGQVICVFCGATDPEASHFDQHNHDICYDSETKDRTFVSKEDLQEHLRMIHGQPAMSRCMEEWSWAPEDNAWYWNCGFCDTLLTSWSDRIEHIGDHFRGGKTMSSWDPLTPPHPLHKTTLTRIPWLPALLWGPETLLALLFEQHNQMSRTHEEEEERQPCAHCGAGIASERELRCHEAVWHLPREVWTCPTTADIQAALHIQAGPLAQFLFPGDDTAAPDNNKDACPYCSDSCAHLGDGWGARADHLRAAHGFGACHPPFKFVAPAHALFHLANVHNVLLGDFTAKVVESCRSEDPPLAAAAKHHD